MKVMMLVPRGNHVFTLHVFHCLDESNDNGRVNIDNIESFLLCNTELGKGNSL